MKVRPARSYERAVQQIIDAIGEQAAAEAVGRSVSLVRKWSDPDNVAMPSIKQAFALDEAFVLQTKQPAPIRAVYAHRLDKVFDALSPEIGTLVMSLFNLHGSIGHMTREIAEILEGKDIEDLKLTPRLRQTLLAEIQNVSERTADLERSIEEH
ncbi:hypothetical protein N9M10_02070 [Hellea sp.]|nr:hypothetical protein [Hellea sp.]